MTVIYVERVTTGDSVTYVERVIAGHAPQPAVQLPDVLLLVSDVQLSRAHLHLHLVRIVSQLMNLKPTPR